MTVIFAFLFCQVFLEINKAQVNKQINCKDGLIPAQDSLPLLFFFYVFPIIVGT